MDKGWSAQKGWIHGRGCFVCADNHSHLSPLLFINITTTANESLN